MLLLAPLLGGLGSVWGTVLGGALVYLLPWLTTTDEPRDRLMLYGLALVALMVLRPQGLLPAGGRTGRARGAPGRRLADPAAE
jgi:branched-chain amino acid transport system permease protein